MNLANSIVKLENEKKILQKKLEIRKRIQENLKKLKDPEINIYNPELSKFGLFSGCENELENGRFSITNPLLENEVYSKLAEISKEYSSIRKENKYREHIHWSALNQMIKMEYRVMKQLEYNFFAEASMKEIIELASSSEDAYDLFLKPKDKNIN